MQVRKKPLFGIQHLINSCFETQNQMNFNLKHWQKIAKLTFFTIGLAVVLTRFCIPASRFFRSRLGKHEVKENFQQSAKFLKNLITTTLNKAPNLIMYHKNTGIP